jgi:NAD(P)-dependent dehydrogenase (short-subunit alcohol dehydrogenase family)
LRPSLDRCKPTGIVLDQDSRVIVALDEGGVGAALVKRLEKLGVTVLVIDQPLTQEALESQAQDWLSRGPVQGVYWLTALDAEPDLSELTLDEWREANRVRVKNLSVTMRVLYEAVKTSDTFLVTAVRLGGLHGYGPQPAVAPLGGGVTGFTKAYKRERPDALVKTVDFEASRKTAAYADRLIAETLADPGVVEVGYYQDKRYTITLREEAAADGQPGVTLDSDTLFLITGAAGGITSAIVTDLATASGGTFYLLDLVAEPDRLDPKIALFRENKDALRQQLIEEAKAKGEKPTPVMIEKQLSAVERSEAALRAIETVEAAGGTAVYRSVNLLDGPALAAIVDEIRQQYGRIDVLVHAGGIEISKALNQKDAAQYDLVYDIKADGFFSLLRAANELPIGATVAFSSVAGRFGNAGQTDYSAANDLLCKVTSSLRRTRPETKAITIDWSAWGGIGMATRGSIPKIMEMAGIEMLPPEAGIPTVRRELTAGGFSGEVLVGGRLGILTDEWETNGGVEPAALTTTLGLHLTAAKVYGGWEAETTPDPKAQPFLYDHAMEGTPLLPGVMGTELFAELAQQMAPDYHVAAVFNEQFHAPFKFYRMEPQTLYLSGTAAPDGQDIIVDAQLHSRRELKTGWQEKLHFNASVRLSKDAPTVEPVAFKPPEQLDIDADAIYKVYFHGPAYRVLESATVEGNRAIGLLAANLPPNVEPAKAAERIAPRLIELCFQTAGVWQIRTQNTMALPLAIGSVTAYRQEREADDRLYAIVEAIDNSDEFNAQVVDESGRVYVTLAGYRTVALPGKVSL